MQRQQLELWETKMMQPHPSPTPLYQELTPEQRRRIIEPLARLILKRVQDNTNPILHQSSEPNDPRQP